MPTPRPARAGSPWCGLVPWLLLAPWALWALWRVVERPTGWPAPAIIAFTPYVTATALVPLLVAFVLRRRLAAVTGLVVVGILGALVVPRAVGSEQPLADGPEITVAAANIAVAAVDPFVLLRRMEELDADVLVIVELSRQAANALEEADVAQRFPYRYLDPRGGGRGTGIWSRWPVELVDDPDLAWGFSAPRVAIDGPDGRTFELVAVHPPAPRTRASTHEWRRHLAALPPTGPDVLRILAGDFNATLDHPELRRILDDGYVDAADEVGEGLTGTWPVRRIPTPRVTIDHILADERMAVRHVEVFDLPGSDHRAVAATLQLPSLPG